MMEQLYHQKINGDQDNISFAIQQRFSNWEEKCLQFGLDPQYGYLTPASYQIKSFDINIFNPILNNLSVLIKQNKIVQQINALSTKIQEEFYTKVVTHRDMFILKQLLNYLVMAYLYGLRKKGLNDEQLYLPAVISKPLHYLAQNLKIKYGFSSGVTYNWQSTVKFKLQKNNSIEKLKAQNDIKLKWYITQDRESQRRLIGFSATTSLFAIKALKESFQINSLIDNNPQEQIKIIEKLRKIVFLIQKCNLQNISCIQVINKNYIVQNWNKHVKGFQNVYLEGVGIKVSSTGGNAGNDPTFQILQAALGLNFQSSQSLAKMQKNLNAGMTEKNKNFKIWMKCNSQIRQYCSIKLSTRRQYNNILRNYIMFWKTHAALVREMLSEKMPPEIKNLPFQKNPFYPILIKQDIIKEHFLKQ